MKCNVDLGPCHQFQIAYGTPARSMDACLLRYRGESRISGMGVHIYKGVVFALLILSNFYLISQLLFNIPWNWNIWSHQIISWSWDYLKTGREVVRHWNICQETASTNSWRSWSIYTQTKKKRPIFMVLYLSIQLRCCNKNKTKMFIKRPTHKNW